MGSKKTVTVQNYKQLFDKVKKGCIVEVTTHYGNIHKYFLKGGKVYRQVNDYKPTRVLDLDSKELISKTDLVKIGA